MQTGKVKGNYLSQEDLYDYFDEYAEKHELVFSDDYDDRFESWLENHAAEDCITYDYNYDQYYVTTDN